MPLRVIYQGEELILKCLYVRTGNLSTMDGMKSSGCLSGSNGCLSRSVRGRNHPSETDGLDDLVDDMSSATHYILVS